MFLVDKLPHDSRLLRCLVYKLVKRLYIRFFFVCSDCPAAELFCSLAVLKEIDRAHLLWRGGLDDFVVVVSAVDGRQCQSVFDWERVSALDDAAFRVVVAH